MKEVSKPLISLQRLYDFAYQDLSGEALETKSAKGKAYNKLVDDLVSIIPTERGLYLFGKFDKRKFWFNIYLGMANKGQVNNLRKRVWEHIYKGRCFIWRSVLPEERILVWEKQIHGGRYQDNWKKYFAMATDLV